MHDDWVYFSDKNFVAIEIQTHDLRDMLLILNLATRKRYWIATQLLEDKIYTRITEFDFEELGGGQFEIHEMKVQPNRIKIEYHAELDYDPNDESAMIYDTAEVFVGQS